MRKPRHTFVVFVFLSLCLSVAIPAQDVPETPYDESEALPYEASPLFSIEVAKLSDRATKTEPSRHRKVSPDSMTPQPPAAKDHFESNQQSQHLSVPRPILNHTLRC
jgi:hypothetical protein